MSIHTYTYTRISSIRSTKGQLLEVWSLPRSHLSCRRVLIWPFGHVCRRFPASQELSVRMHACVCVFMRVCAYACMCIRMHAHACSCMHVYVCAYAYMCARSCICVCVRVRACICVYVYVHLWLPSTLPVMHKCVYTCKHMCVYIYVCMCTCGLYACISMFTQTTIQTYVRM